MYYIITKKGLTIFSLSLIFILMFTLSCFVFAGNTKSWGLSFSNPNEPPRGNASCEELLKYNSYFMGNTNEKCLYLTFDAGYEAGYTESILDTLKKHNVKAAFFVVGSYIKNNPELITRMVDEGHIVANHTNTHPDMSKISTLEDFKGEIEPVEKIFEEVTKTTMPKFYRPPRGVYDISNLENAQKLGYKTIFWSVAYVDWEKDNQPSHEKALSLLNSRVHNGAILLLHSTSKTNMEILDKYLSGLKEQGYTFKTLDQIGK